jgi:hypothetical protein
MNPINPKDQKDERNEIIAFEDDPNVFRYFQ